MYTYVNVLGKSIPHAENIYFTQSVYLVLQLESKSHIFHGLASNANVS